MVNRAVGIGLGVVRAMPNLAFHITHRRARTFNANTTQQGRIHYNSHPQFIHCTRKNAHFDTDNMRVFREVAVKVADAQEYYIRITLCGYIITGTSFGKTLAMRKAITLLAPSTSLAF